MLGPEVIRWFVEHEPELKREGFRYKTSFPNAGSETAWGASIGMVYDDVVAQYSVWEAREDAIPQRDTLVVDGRLKRTMLHEERRPMPASEVAAEMDQLLAQILSGHFARARRFWHKLPRLRHWPFR